jgi:hypothetical protein
MRGVNQAAAKAVGQQTQLTTFPFPLSLHQGANPCEMHF